MKGVAIPTPALRRSGISLFFALILLVNSVSNAAAADATTPPNDPLWSEQWSLSSQASVGINLLEAWRYSRGAGVVVAVVDTGITSHPEFKGRVLPGYDFVSNDRTSGDGDGRDADPSDPGDYITDEEISSGGVFSGCQREDSSWHGTHVAGIILAAANNKVGIAGIAPEASLLPVRALGKCGGTDSDLVDSLRWAAGLSVPNAPENLHPAKIINVSLGGEGACSQRLQGTVDEITSLGTIIVVATGNANRDASLYSPANCNGTLTVGATTREGFRAKYSNFGTYVDLSAPGGDEPSEIISLLNSGLKGPEAPSYKAYSGTSMATPHVSGVLALALSIDSVISREDLLTLLLATSSPFIGDGSSLGCTQQPLCGAGLVNGGALIAALVARTTPTLNVSGPASMEINSSQAFSVALDGVPAPLTLMTPEVCSLTEGVLTSITRGSCEFEYVQMSSAKYKAYTTRIKVQVIGLTSSVTITSIGKVKPGSQRALDLVSETDGTRKYKSLTLSVCSVTKTGIIRAVRAGSCRIRVRIAGTSLYEPYSSVVTIAVKR